MESRRTGDDEKAARYRRLRELGTEGGLRAAGFSEESIVAIVDHMEKTVTYDRFSCNVSTPGMVDTLSEIEDGRAVLLALLRRRSDSPLSIALNKWECANVGVDVPTLDENDAIALCVSLSADGDVRYVSLQGQTVFGTPWGCTLLANALRANSSLQSLLLSEVGMGSEGVTCLMQGIASTLRELYIGRNALSDDGIVYVAEMLSSNTSLTQLDVFDTSSGFRGAEHLSSALECNTALQTLQFGHNDFGRDGMKRLLATFSKDRATSPSSSSDGPKNTTVTALFLDEMTLENFCVESLAWLIKTNNTLTHLSLERTQALRPQDYVDHLFPALKENSTLQNLCLWECSGLVGKDVHDALMDLARSSGTGLEGIDLTYTGMEDEGGRVEQELTVHREKRARLQS